MMAIFDTNIIIDYLRDIPEAKKIMSEYSDGSGVGICAVFAFELAAGVKTREEGALLSFLLFVTVYPFDLKSAQEAAMLYKKLRSAGSELGTADMSILGTAKANDETFVTQDNDFEGTYEKIVIVKKGSGRH